jgi:hypothetical protein
MRRLRNSFSEFMVAWHSWRTDRHRRARVKWMERLPAGPRPGDVTVSFPPRGTFREGIDG